MTIPLRLCASVLCLVALPGPLIAQVSDTTRPVTGSTVRGIVWDSIAVRPLSGAVVQFISADSLTHVGRTTTSDSAGQFRLDDIPRGRFTIGFFHPMLDSLGLEPTLRDVSVDGRGPVRVDLAIPSATRLRVAICGPPSGADSGGGVIVGAVRDAHGRAAMSGVTVTGEWLEYIFTTQAIGHRAPRLVATTGPTGWFAICNVPSPGTIALMASRGADSTDLIEAQVPATGFLRRELYLGSTRVAADSRLTGTVFATVGNRPLAGAQVSISGGQRIRTNDRGEWVLFGAPDGTRTLEVRAVGFYPERRSVDIVAGSPPIRTELSTMSAVLDTVRITASRMSDANNKGFQERRRSGVGRYVTTEDVARRDPLITSDMLALVPGLRIELSQYGDRYIVLRGCSPNIYIDGHYMRDLTADDIDSWVHPDEIAGIEVYSGAGVPAQFNRGLGGENCGSIVIWSRPSLRPRNPASWKNRLVSLVGVAAVAVAIGALLRRH